jgi:hypothetical protein
LCNRTIYYATSIRISAGVSCFQSFRLFRVWILVLEVHLVPKIQISDDPTSEFQKDMLSLQYFKAKRKCLNLLSIVFSPLFNFVLAVVSLLFTMRYIYPQLAVTIPSPSPTHHELPGLASVEQVDTLHDLIHRRAEARKSIQATIYYFYMLSIQ